ncbi:MAG: carboxy terminal-processing peptidase [Candidatus Aminicenantes bacterium]|nr:carboxy terminal-processing peptidase [Candidatus Aminicenantes bacterium]
MKKKIFILGSLIIVVAIFLSNTLFTINGSERVTLLSHIIYRGLMGYHYSGKAIDDEFSQKAFKEYLELQDVNKRYLLKADIERLQKYKDKIDDEFNEGKTELMEITTQILQQRIEQVMGFYEGILAKPFDFTKDENFEFDPDKRDYCTNLTELKELWRKTLKYRTLVRYVNLLRAKKKELDDKKTGKKKENDKTTGTKNKNETGKNVEKKEQSKQELEKKAREAVLKSYKNIFNRTLQANKNDALSRYLNAVVNVYDPHTLYFPPKEQEDFEMEMSGTFEGIGALLGEKDGYVTISRIIVGGPSWRQKKLQPGDLILKVGQADEEPVDIVGMRVVDAVKLIRGKKDTIVKLTVKRPDGQIKVIPIVRGVVIIEDTFARSAVLYQEKLKRTFGYIYLPRFYNDFSRSDGRNSTDDVKKELEKLEAKKVEGIILDLRYNSGGALRDAIRMSGLFLQEGPVVQVKDKDGDPRIYNDPDPAVNYKGPLIVLINTLSASASEILSAALQDYNRAVIVGGAGSFGKGTVQVMLNLDRYIVKRREDSKPLGALAITIQKFYRIDGTSIQLRGVTPDVVLPDRFDYLELGEKYYDYPLPWDSVAPAPYKKWSSDLSNREMLAAKSKQRVDKSPRFALLKKYIGRLKDMRKDTLQSLQLEKVMKKQAERQKETDKLDKFEKKTFPVKVLPAQEMDKNLSERMAKEVKARQKDWFERIEKDMYLFEAMAILNDMIKN